MRRLRVSLYFGKPQVLTRAVASSTLTVPTPNDPLSVGLRRPRYVAGSVPVGVRHAEGSVGAARIPVARKLHRERVFPVRAHRIKKWHRCYRPHMYHLRSIMDLWYEGDNVQTLPSTCISTDFPQRALTGGHSTGWWPRPCAVDATTYSKA
ncbi:hypothetical protein BV22DRAFT_42769 [Leucogyrophana mollusca]|uniref:Uncharacterized protein n=1 Tax=Leucogyrophana mollusca TaxID=85980 RepID=A0ACB8BYX9_9AGAM|nr:hypothetical protein BV22DRAFT_42769 [Leucogyrophana mollusca]